MIKIHQESDFKLQVYFPGFVENEFQPFTLSFYTNKNKPYTISYSKAEGFVRCERCVGGVIATFKAPRFALGTLQVDASIHYVDSTMPDQIYRSTDTITTDIEIVDRDAGYSEPTGEAVVGIPSYNACTQNPYPIVVVPTYIGPKGDKGERGDQGPMPSYDFTLLTEQATSDISFSRHGTKRTLYCQTFILTEVAKNQVVILKGVNTTSAVVRVEGVVFNDDQGDVYQQFSVSPCLAFTGVKASPFYYLQIDTTPFSHLWNPKVYLTVFFTKM